MKLKSGRLFKQLIISVCLTALVSPAAPVPVTNIITSPGFGPEVPEVDSQRLDYIRTAAGWYALTGATCTECVNGIFSYAINEPVPSSRTVVLSGLKLTQSVLNIGATGARFDLGVLVTNDSVGIVLSEIGPSSVPTGDPVRVLPTTNGVAVGSWKLDIVAADYADTGYYWKNNYSSYEMRSFITTFRLSDFSGDTGSLVFDGIQLTGNNNYDPNLVATIGAVLPPYVNPVSRRLPATGIFSPGFVLNPETNLQTLASIITSEGTFSVITGLTCTAVSSGDYYQTDTNVPSSKTDAASGLKFTEVVANASSLTFSIGRTVTSADEGIRFFLSECEIDVLGTMDKIIVYPLAGTTPIYNWCLELASEDYGTPSAGWRATRPSDAHTVTFYGSMISFALTDFTNGPPVALTGVDGFRIVCPLVDTRQADIGLFGMYAIPPSGTIIVIH